MPIGRLKNPYVPLGPVTVDWVRLVAGLTMRTAAPVTTAPLGSVTVPCIFPRSTCAKRPQAKVTARSANLIEFPSKDGSGDIISSGDTIILRQANAIGVVTAAVL